MRIGFDIDGVLANFVKAYQLLTVKVTGKYLFKPGDILDPPCWDWPQFRGYTEKDMKDVWAVIMKDPTFWMNLEPLYQNVGTLGMTLAELERHHEVYYITSRPGDRPKRQTEVWLVDHLRYPARCRTYPTVCVVGKQAKGHLAKHLQLDAYIDDNYENAFNVGMESPTTQNYLLDARYNRLGDGPFKRVKTLGEMFDCEIAAGRL